MAQPALLWEQIPLEAPLSAVAAKVCARPSSFWLDSALAHQRFGRYSFLGWDPFLILESKNGIINISADGRTQPTGGDPFEVLHEFLLLYCLPHDPRLPPLTAGAVGYLGYDLCHHLERLPHKSCDDLHLPNCWLGFYDRILVYDHSRQELFAFSSGLPAGTGRSRLRRARARLAEVRHLIENVSGLRPTVFPSHGPVPVTSNFTPAGFLEAVARAREYIFAGDIFQVNLAQRFRAPLMAPPFAIYQRLRDLNPAPFAAYLHLPEVIVASSSPERFLRLQGRQVETRPIKGTRPRGKDPTADQALKRELWSSAKDRAELAMIVDLERNDLGRVCEVGSVRVPRMYSLEAYSTVFHLVATIVGTLARGRGFVDCLKAAFPGGSITGAPKVRAMEIIDELEPVRRGIYTGSLGYISFSGRAADLNIAIRTMVIKGQTIYFHAGGGIVADSVPELEYVETLAKAKALIKTVQTARAGTWPPPAR